MTADAAGSIGAETHEERFTVPIGHAGGVELVAAALCRKLADLASRRGAGHIVIVSIVSQGWNYYTQCMTDPDHGAWIEAVSNQYIEPAELRLDAGQEGALAALGFDPPDDFSPNHYRTVDQPVSWRWVAELLITPLVAVYGATANDVIQVTVGPRDGVISPAVPAAERNTGASSGKPQPRLFLLPDEATDHEMTELVDNLRSERHHRLPR